MTRHHVRLDSFQGGRSWARTYKRKGAKEEGRRKWASPTCLPFDPVSPEPPNVRTCERSLAPQPLRSSARLFGPRTPSPGPRSLSPFASRPMVTYARAHGRPAGVSLGSVVRARVPCCVGRSFGTDHAPWLLSGTGFEFAGPDESRCRRTRSPHRVDLLRQGRAQRVDCRCPGPRRAPSHSLHGRRWPVPRRAEADTRREDSGLRPRRGVQQRR